MDGRQRVVWPSIIGICPSIGGPGDSLPPDDPHQADTLSCVRVLMRDPTKDSVAGGGQWDASPTVPHEGSTEFEAGTVEDDTALHIRERSMPPTTMSLAAVGPIASRSASAEITAETRRALASLPPPSAEPASNPDPTVSTKLDPGWVHLVPGTLVGDYEIEKLLGSGGMGAVYGARHEKLRRRAAVKVIAPSLSRDRDAVERFEQEALSLARLSHPNIVSVLDIGTLPGDGRAFFIMEWLDGESVHARLERGRVPLDEALDLVDQIARGLEAAHAAGIVHRDLKPDNIWLARIGDEVRPNAKLLDFGLSKLSEHRRSEETSVGVMFGTPSYMSPEQCQSARDVGPPTDVYALGCLMFELFLGRLPFIYDNLAELIVAQQTEEPPRPRDLDPTIDRALDELVFMTLAKDPDARPTLARLRAVIADVQQRSAFEMQRATPPGSSSSTITAPRRATTPSVPASRALPVVVAAVAGAVIILAIVIISTSRSSRSQADDDNSERADHRIEHGDDTDSADVSSKDANVTTPPATTPTNKAQPVDEASTTAAQERPGRTTVAPRRVRAPVADVSREQVDAGVAAELVDAAGAVQIGRDAGQVAAPATKPTAVPTVPESQVRRPSSPSIPKKGVDKNDRDKTYNPFTKQPASL